jgi:hypothetical protein
VVGSGRSGDGRSTALLFISISETIAGGPRDGHAARFSSAVAVEDLFVGGRQNLEKLEAACRRYQRPPRVRQTAVRLHAVDDHQDHFKGLQSGARWW